MTVLWRLGAWIARWIEDHDRGEAMSSAWLREQDRIDRRVEYHGRSLVWPIQKAENENGIWNRYKLRRRA